MFASFSSTLTVLKTAEIVLKDNQTSKNCKLYLYVFQSKLRYVCDNTLNIYVFNTGHQYNVAYETVRFILIYQILNKTKMYKQIR